jgi:hypothetical protein
MEKAEKAFWSQRKVLSSGNCSIISKLRLLSEILKQVGLWSAGSWNLTLQQASTLRGFQQRLLRKVISIKGADGMQFEIMERLVRKVKYWKGLAKWESLDVAQRRLQHEWAGHVERTMLWRSEPWAARIMHWRDRRWLDEMVVKHGHQMHGRKVRVWRREHNIINKVGKNWHSKTRSKDEWRKLFTGRAEA